MSDYPLLSRILHRLALNSQTRREILFDLEKAIYLRDAPYLDNGTHVFISGLARAGTTVLMRELYRSGQFASLTYLDMPFVMSPNIWSLIHRDTIRPQAPKVRAHLDGVLIDFESPEGFEEVFWQTLDGERYVSKAGLKVYRPEEDSIEEFRNYLRLVLRRGKKQRYLSKNNNSILRLPTLHEKIENAIFLIPIRSPLPHAESLLAQHLRFSSSNSFTAKYMEWLGHFEFGCGHKQFQFPNSVPPSVSPLSIDYWLLQWLDCYGYLQELQRELPRAYFVPYESLCEQRAVWTSLLRLCEIQAAASASFTKSSRTTQSSPNLDLLTRAEEVYSRILGQALEKLLN